MTAFRAEKSRTQKPIEPNPSTGWREHVAWHYSTKDLFRQIPNDLLARYFHSSSLFNDLDFSAIMETQPEEGS